MSSAGGIDELARAQEMARQPIAAAAFRADLATLRTAGEVLAALLEIKK